MQATFALCLILVTTVAAIGTTRNGTDIKKTGNVYISDCYLNDIKPGKVKFSIISRRNTDPEAKAVPVKENFYVWDIESAIARPELFEYMEIWINNINHYRMTVRNILDYDSCIDDDTCMPKKKRIIEIKATEAFRNVPQGRVPAYTVMGENWGIYLMDCYSAGSNTVLGTTTTENLYITDNDSATDRLPKRMSTTSTKIYNVTIRNAVDLEHCVIADAPCWPYDKTTIKITSIE